MLVMLLQKAWSSQGADEFQLCEAQRISSIIFTKPSVERNMIYWICREEHDLFCREEHDLLREEHDLLALISTLIFCSCFSVS